MSAEHESQSHDDARDVPDALDVPPGGGGETTDVVDGLTRVLARACRQLGDAGHPREAGKLAADGWVLLRETHHKQAERLDGTMHYTARLEAQLKE